jgi:hypothetical protein
MRLPRTTIAALMGLIALLAIAFAALVHPTPLWAAVCFSGMLLALTFASLAAIFSRGGRRAYWTGFLVGGSSYLVLQYGPLCVEHVGPHTLPTAMLDFLNGALTFPHPTTVTFSRQTHRTVLPEVALPAAEVLPPAVERVSGQWSRDQVPFPAQSSHDVWVFWTAKDQGGSSPFPDTPPEFSRVGHSFLSLIVAFVFGAIARRLAKRNTEGAGDPAS